MWQFSSELKYFELGKNCLYYQLQSKEENFCEMHDNEVADSYK